MVDDTTTYIIMKTRFEGKTSELIPRGYHHHLPCGPGARVHSTCQDLAVVRTPRSQRNYLDDEMINSYWTRVGCLVIVTARCRRLLVWTHLLASRFLCSLSP